jgi:hypothetical protein
VSCLVVWRGSYRVSWAGAHRRQSERLP